MSGVCCKNAYDLGTIRLACNFNSHQRLHVRIIYTTQSQEVGSKNIHTDKFYQWLVGFTDGSGTFTIDRINNGTYWNLVYKISQKKSNGQILYHIKSKQGVGHVTKSSENNWSFRIRNINHQIKEIFPIFDTFPQVTVKYYDYVLIKQAAEIISSNEQNREEKNRKMEKIQTLIKKGPNKEYKSVVWEKIDCNHIIGKHKNIISTLWLIGFLEAEGCFYIVQKDKNIQVHGMGLTIKKDVQIQEVIRQIFDSKAKIIKNRRSLQDYYSWDSTSKEVIKFAIDYLDGHFKGRQSLRFSIWRKSLNYTDYKLLIARDQLRKM